MIGGENNAVGVHVNNKELHDISLIIDLFVFLFGAYFDHGRI